MKSQMLGGRGLEEQSSARRWGLDEQTSMKGWGEEKQSRVYPLNSEYTVTIIPSPSTPWLVKANWNLPTHPIIPNPLNPLVEVLTDF